MTAAEEIDLQTVDKIQKRIYEKKEPKDFFQFFQSICQTGILVSFKFIHI